MTPDEVMALTDKELLVKAYELDSGLRVLRHEIHDRMQCVKTAGGSGTTWIIIPDYPHDIAAAWELWEKLPKRRMLYDLDGKTYCTVGGYSEGGCLCEGEADEGEEAKAITRAFILARAH